MTTHEIARRHIASNLEIELGRKVYRTKVEKAWRIGDKTYAWALLLFSPAMPETCWVVGIAEYVTQGNESEVFSLIALDCWPMSSLDNATRLFGFLAEKQPRVAGISPDLGAFTEPGESVWMPVKGADRRAGILGGIVKSVIDRWPIGSSIIEQGHTFCRGLTLANIDGPVIDVPNFSDRSSHFIKLLKPADRISQSGSLLTNAEDWRRWSEQIEKERVREIELNQKYGVGQKEMPGVAYDYVSPWNTTTENYVYADPIVQQITRPRRGRPATQITADQATVYARERARQNQQSEALDRAIRAMQADQPFTMTPAQPVDPAPPLGDQITLPTQPPLTVTPVEPHEGDDFE